MVMFGAPEGGRKVVAVVFMPLRSLPPSDSYSGSGACPTSSWPRVAIAPRPTSAPTFRRETLPPLAFFAGLPAAVVPEDYSFASNASARQFLSDESIEAIGKVNSVTVRCGMFGHVSVAAAKRD
jgi:hypothetical protein